MPASCKTTVERVDIDIIDDRYFAALYSFNEICKASNYLLSRNAE